MKTRCDSNNGSDSSDSSDRETLGEKSQEFLNGEPPADLRKKRR